METKYLLTNDRTNLLKIGLLNQNKTTTDLERSISEVRDWVKQDDFPEIPNDNVISNFILINKFNLDETKEKLKMYYKIRRMLPELFFNKHPNLPHMQKIIDTLYNIPLPQTTKEGYRVSIVHLQNIDTEVDVYDLFGQVYNLAEIRLNEDVANGEVLIYDAAHVNLNLVTQFTPNVIRKLLMVLDKVFSNRVKQVNYINAPPIAQAFVKFVKPLLKTKLINRIHMHSSLDSLYQLVPREILPKDYGGEEMYLSQLNELWKKKLLEYGDRFTSLESMTNTIPIPQKDDLFGIQGSFKTLNID